MGPDMHPCEYCRTAGYLDDSASSEAAGSNCIKCPACRGRGEVVARCVECHEPVINLVCTWCGCGDDLVRSY